MKFEIHERLALLSLLPKEGDYAALRAYRRAREMLSPTPEELEYLEMKQTIGADGKPVLDWNTGKAANAVKDCPIDEYMMHVFQDLLSDRNKKKKLDDQLVSVYEKLVIAYS